MALLVNIQVLGDGFDTLSLISATVTECQAPGGTTTRPAAASSGMVPARPRQDLELGSRPRNHSASTGHNGTMSSARSDYSRSTPSLVKTLQDDLRYVNSVKTNLSLGMPIRQVIVSPAMRKPSSYMISGLQSTNTAPPMTWLTSTFELSQPPLITNPPKPSPS